MMLKIIHENPYRILGIFSNSSTKEKLANHNKMKAYSKIGKSLNMPLDLVGILPLLERTYEKVEDADSKLALPVEKLKYAQFWFIKCDSFDEIAFNHLISGNIEMAVSIWNKKETFSSLQNRIVCALIQENYQEAINCAEQLYSSYLKIFVSNVLGDVMTVDFSMIEYDFLDTLISGLKGENLLRYIHNSEWISYVKKQNLSPLLQDISEILEVAKSSRGKGPLARYKAGNTLINDSKVYLPRLRDLVGNDSVQYAMIADRLGLEILQCGIDYYNDSEPLFAARKALTIQQYALSVVVGHMAVERCKENIGILKNIIKNLPPEEVANEVKFINKELESYCNKADTIDLAIDLLNNVRPSLVSIRIKLGAGNEYYLSISTKVINNALYNIIEEVNSIQEKVNDISALIILTSTLKKAWKATLIMDSFDMESKFRTERYNENRKILKGLCDKLQIPTSPVVKKPIQSRPQSVVKQKTIESNKSVPTKNTKGGTENGCVISFLFIVFILAIFIAIGLSNQGESTNYDDIEIADDSCSFEDSTLCDTVVYYSDTNSSLDNEITIESKNSSEYYEKDENSQYIHNRLSTGSKPYSYMGRTSTGENYMSFKTSGNCDFIVIVRNATNDKYMNHIYIRGGDNAKLYLPDGIFNVFFYSGNGWNPNKIKGSYKGGFVENESLQKDESISLYSAYIEYTLYPVQNGNLHLDNADDDEAFK